MPAGREPAGAFMEERMEPIDTIIQQQAQRGNQPGELPVLSLSGLLDLLDALQPELEYQGGLVSVFSIALKEELARGLGYDL
jgi:hypothetical protein